MPKRTNKSKEEIAQLAKHKAEIDHQKELIRAAWPYIAEGLTIYDAQTVANAVGGFLRFELQRRQEAIKVNDLAIDVTNEKDAPIRDAMAKVLDVFKDESAIDAAGLLERLGKTLGVYSAHVYMKQNMSALKVEDIVA